MQMSVHSHRPTRTNEASQHATSFSHSFILIHENNMSHNESGTLLSDALCCSCSSGHTCRSGHLLFCTYTVYAARALGSHTVVLIDDYRSRRKSSRHHEAVFSEPRVVSGKTRAACTLIGHSNVWINPVTVNGLLLGKCCTSITS